MKIVEQERKAFTEVQFLGLLLPEKGNNKRKEIIMIKFENVTDLKKFEKMVNNQEYAIEKANDGLTISHNLHYAKYLYGLQKVAKNEYVFWSKNDDYFSVHFKSLKNVIEIISGEKGNRKLKSDRTLKQFSKILCLANSVIQLYDL